MNRKAEGRSGFEGLPRTIVVPSTVGTRGEYAERTIGQPVHVTNQVTWTDVNQNGVYGCDLPCTARNIYDLVSFIAPQGARVETPIKILSGCHGDGFGNLHERQQGDPDFFGQDRSVNEGFKRWSSTWVTVLNCEGKNRAWFDRKAPSTNNTIVIYGWCYSERSIRNWQNITASWMPNF